jgi:hypothetical protein
MRIVMGIAALALIAGGGWFFLSRHQPSLAKATATKASTSSSSRAAAAVPAIAHDSVVARRDSVAPTAANVAERSAKNTPASSTLEAASTESEAKHASHSAKETTASAPAPDADAILAPTLPSIKVDAITNMIDDSARERADSVGRVITEKPPTFKPKAYRPPGS